LVPPPFLKPLSAWLATAAAIAILISIPASQILLALAIAALLFSGLPLRWPRIAIPLGLFLVWTLLSLAFSPHPADGLTQVRKIYVFLTMLTIFSSIRTLRETRLLVLAWAGVGTITAAKGLWQYASKVSEAAALHRNFYDYYIDNRITGFQSHWMTFSGQELFLLLMAAAFLLFGPGVRKQLWIWLPCALVICAALELSETRSVWAAAAIAGAYLVWEWKRLAVAALPVLLILGFLAAPPHVKQRVRSFIHPTAETDSNRFRYIVWRTGWEMIKAHPVFGVGPEEVGKEFNTYLPADIPKPLPSGFYQHLHSIYVHYAAERGVPAALLLTAALLMAIVDFRRALRTLPPGRSDRRFILQWAIATVIGAMVVGAMDLNLGLTDELTMFLVVMSLGYLAASPEAATQ
jgi:O-antigen ligase